MHAVKSMARLGICAGSSERLLNDDSIDKIPCADSIYTQNGALCTLASILSCGNCTLHNTTSKQNNSN